MSASKLKASCNVDSSKIGEQGNNLFVMTGGAAQNGKQINVDYGTIKRKLDLLASNANLRFESASPEVKEAYSSIVNLFQSYHDYGNQNSYPALWNMLNDSFKNVGTSPIGTIGQLIGGCVNSGRTDNEMACDIGCIYSKIKPQNKIVCQHTVIIIDGETFDVISNVNSKTAILYIKRNDPRDNRNLLTPAQVDKIKSLGVTEVIINKIDQNGVIIPYNRTAVNINNFCVCWYNNWWAWIIGLIVVIILIILIVAVIVLAIKRSKCNDDIDSDDLKE